jgi:hypothetical protein
MVMFDPFHELSSAARCIAVGADAYKETTGASFTLKGTLRQTSLISHDRDPTHAASNGRILQHPVPIDKQKILAV